ncbi:MAG: VIT family protein [Terriglobales bacterium]
MFVRHRERHRTGPTGWLRASVLGANDGILSTASLVLGVAAAHATHSNVLVAGVAGLVAGSMSMAAGEYVSVHSQADTEQADLALERAELKTDDKGEHKELMAIYVARGLNPALAKQVAEQLMDHDALGAHARDELGISDTFRARPIQAAGMRHTTAEGPFGIPPIVRSRAILGLGELFQNFSLEIRQFRIRLNSTCVKIQRSLKGE